MDLHEMLPSRIKVLPEFMDGGETLRQRDHWPISSFRNRRDYTPGEVQKIHGNECPRCGSRLSLIRVISCGDQGQEKHCYKCGASFYPPEPVEEFNPFKPHPKAKAKFQHKTQRSFLCKHCGAKNHGIFSVRQCFCPGTNCAQDYWKIQNRENYRAKNNLSRYLGREK